MSLVIMFKDEMAADQRCVLRMPHAYGQTYNTVKLKVSKDKTFAFASAGTTLTEKEQSIFEAILSETFRKSEGDHPVVELAHQEWFSSRETLVFLVMTKAASYHSYIVGSEEAKVSAYGPEISKLETHSLLQFDSDFPAGYGTGLQVAAMALREGVKMKELMPIVADVEFSVGPEFDYIHRRSLKRMV